MSNKRTLNLDRAREARAEKVGPPPIVVLDGVEYTLPASPPALAFVALAEVQDGDLTQLRPGLEVLFGKDNTTALLEQGLDLDDLGDILDLYDMGGESEALGEASASGGSSSKSSRRSRQTSTGTTRST